MFCESSGSMVPKDKAVKRFLVRNIVESAAIRDLQESCVFDCEFATLEKIPPRRASTDASADRSITRETVQCPRRDRTPVVLPHRGSHHARPEPRH